MTTSPLSISRQIATFAVVESISLTESNAELTYGKAMHRNVARTGITGGKAERNGGPADLD